MVNVVSIEGVAQYSGLLGAVSLALTAPLLYLATVRLRFAGPEPPAERIFLPTPDGARLALYHYSPFDPPVRREPILLISGFGLNRWALDFDPRYSWARRLATEGFDTWILEVRGSGNSRRAGLRDGDFDDYLLDARTAVLHVLERTGASRLHWIGYSLGGMLLYATLGTDLADRIRCGVAVESPVSLAGYPLDRASLAVMDVLERFPWLHTIPYRLPSRLAMDLLPLFYEKPLFKTWMNTANIDKAILKALVYRTLDDVPTPLVLQFREWMQAEGLFARGGGLDYLEGLKRTSVPILLVTGASDFARRARRVLELARPKNVHWVECVKAKGFSADYGHADLIFGRHAPEEVFPHVLNWVRAHDPADSRAIT